MFLKGLSELVKGLVSMRPPLLVSFFPFFSLMFLVAISLSIHIKKLIFSCLWDFFFFFRSSQKTFFYHKGNGTSSPEVRRLLKSNKKNMKETVLSSVKSLLIGRFV